MRRRLTSFLVQAWLPVTLVVVWWFGSANSTSPFFPPLSEIVQRFRENWLFAQLDQQFVPSVWRFLVGFALACLTAIPIGLALGLRSRARRSTAPTVDFLRSIPVTILVSAFVVLLGFGSAMNVAFIAWASFFPVLLNTVDGVRGLEPTQRDVARCYRLPLRDRVFRVVLPAASPQIFAGMRVSLAVGLLVMVYGEMVSTTNGLGYFILFAQNTFRVTDMWSGIVLLGILGYVVNVVFVAIERRALGWHRGWRASILDGPGA